MVDRKFPRLVYNRISMIGIFMAGVSALIMTFLYVIGLFGNGTNPYFGIFLYMVMPVFLILGLVLIPVGMFRNWRHLKKYGGIPPTTWPKMDLNDSRQRNAVIIFTVGTILFLGASAIGSYQAFHFSESVTFCGKVCHKVMKPEYTAYKHSPHARVACVECHVGPGADWYAKSKLSGAYQVYAVMVNNYPRPIPTPISNLRPARETCEQCHWPAKFFGGMQKVNDHYMYDEENTHWPIEMLVKVGGGNFRTGEATDIHWHVNINQRVEFIARDKKDQDIPWVQVINEQTGDSVVYQNEDDPLSQAEIDSLPRHTMDCVDCHTRPSHIYRSPDYAVDQALAIGQISPSLPFIKKIAVEAMSEEYKTQEEGMAAIDSSIRAYYDDLYPNISDSLQTEILAASAAVQNEFALNIFPIMKVRWSEYPDNIGHFDWPGCNRCHLGNHVNDKGEKITHNCDACHRILAQGSGERRQVASTEEGLEFVHPEDIYEAWREMPCSDCHTGVQP